MKTATPTIPTRTEPVDLQAAAEAVSTTPPHRCDPRETVCPSCDPGAENIEDRFSGCEPW